MEIKKIDILSAAKIGSLMHLVGALIWLTIVLSSLIFKSVPQEVSEAFNKQIPTLLLLCFALIPLFGGIVSSIFALGYNILARFVGGLKIEIRQ